MCRVAVVFLILFLCTHVLSSNRELEFYQRVFQIVVGAMLSYLARSILAHNYSRTLHVIGGVNA